MKFDLTITFSVILAFVAAVSSTLTTLINNIHDSKMKQLDLKREHLSNTVGHQKDIFEKYLRCAGRNIAVADSDAEKEYTEYYLLASLYVSDDIRFEMIKTHKYIEDGEWEKATSNLQNLIPKIRDFLQEL